MKRSWRDQYRKCDACKSEYRPKRQAQSYCSPRCKRAAAYGRERFAAGTKRRLDMKILPEWGGRDFESITRAWPAEQFMKCGQAIKRSWIPICCLRD